jgi:hypothetical protein
MKVEIIKETKPDGEEMYFIKIDGFNVAARSNSIDAFKYASKAEENYLKYGSYLETETIYSKEI